MDYGISVMLYVLMFIHFIVNGTVISVFSFGWFSTNGTDNAQKLKKNKEIQ